MPVFERPPLDTLAPAKDRWIEAEDLSAALKERARQVVGQVVAADFSTDAEAHGGKLWPLVREGTGARRTNERVKRLRELLIEEGEYKLICSGFDPVVVLHSSANSGPFRK